MLESNLIGFEGLDNNPDFNDLIVSLNFSLNNQADNSKKRNSTQYL